jgi:hypothetical protein
LILKKLIALSVTALALMSANSYTVNHGTTVQVDEWSVCKQVTNNHASSQALFVPTKTATEWTTFYTHLPSGVTATDCCVSGLQTCLSSAECCDFANGNIYCNTPATNHCEFRLTAGEHCNATGPSDQCIDGFACTLDLGVGGAFCCGGFCV